MSSSRELGSQAILPSGGSEVYLVSGHELHPYLRDALLFPKRKAFIETNKQSAPVTNSITLPGFVSQTQPSTTIQSVQTQHSIPSSTHKDFKVVQILLKNISKFYISLWISKCFSIIHLQIAIMRNSLIRNSGEILEFFKN